MRPPLIPQPIPFHGNELDYIKLLKKLYNTLVEYRDPHTGRIIISIFMCLPSRKDFPEYFEIIQRPISMYEIRKRIENGYYQSEEPCLNDFRLMFNNCRTFNEDGSMIFQDAVRLEELLFDKYDQYTSDDGANVKRLKTSDSPARSPSTVPASLAPSTTISNTPTPTRKGRKYNTLRNSSLHQTIPRRYNKKNSTPTPNKFQNRYDNNNSYNNHLSSTPYVQQHNEQQSFPNNNHNGLASDADSNSNSNQYSSCNGNTNDSFITNHSFHNDASIDSNSNLSIGPLASSASTNDKPTKRLKRDPDAPKKRLLTGYIIYAAEVRKEYVDKHPNQDFGFISRLIGNDWKALPKDLRVKYDQRALVHNKKMREKALRDSMMAPADGQSQFQYYNNQLHQQSQGALMTNGSSTPRLTKKRLAKLAKEQAKMHNSSAPYHDNSFSTPMRQDRPSQVAQGNYSSFRPTDSQRYPYSTQQGNYGQQNQTKSMTVESATQTAPFRFVEPPSRRRHVYVENFKRYIESLDVPNMDLLAEETACPDRPTESVDTWLGGGTGRHGSTENALWALRDFMLLDSNTMRLNMQPYLCYQ